MVENHMGHRRRVPWEAIESEQGVLIEIMSRLPVKSICMFRGLNRYLRHSLKSVLMVKNLLSKSREKPSYIACPNMNSRMELYFLKPRSLRFQHLTTVDPPARSVENYMYMISSFNGLVCCINHLFAEDEDHFEDLQIWICNPCTEDILLLPQGRPSFKTEPRIGVAHEAESSEYKVFRIFGVEENEFQCEVYSSINRAWRNIGSVPRLPKGVCFSPYNSSHVFAGGKIYWLVSLKGHYGEILCVDAQERFEVVELPEYPRDVREEDQITIATYLINLEGSLSVVILHADYMDIWVWKEDCSWEFVCCDTIPFECCEIVVFMTSSNKEILLATETHLWTYGLDTNMWKKVRKPPTEFVNPVMLPFTESLVPCKGGWE